jgi:thiol-disulfide isomerase/thioredoxin
MRYILFYIILITACTSVKKSTENYFVQPDAETKVINGIFSRHLLETDSSFIWFKTNMQWARPDAATVKLFQEKKHSISLVVFAGTWCHDTQNILPKFYKLIDAAGFPAEKILLVGVSRNKTDTAGLYKKYSLVNVPTFIVLHKGKEVGRVVEYGKEGDPMKELGVVVGLVR